MYHAKYHPRPPLPTPCPDQTSPPQPQPQPKPQPRAHTSTHIQTSNICEPKHDFGPTLSPP